MSLSPVQAAAARKEAVSALWRRGELSWMLDSNQEGLYREAQPHSSFVVEAGRKVGKSFLACIIALETGIRHPGSRTNYACPTSKMAYEIVVPVVEQIAREAPAELRPEWSSQTGHITFPGDGPARGSYTVLGGCEDEKKADRLRGPQAQANILDEAGFIGPLQYTLTSVLNPQLIRTGGKTYTFSSPPFSPGHEFGALADAHALHGAYAHRDIYSCTLLSRARIDEYIAGEAAARGLSVEAFKATSDFKREFLALRVVDESRAVIPEWSQGGEQACVKEHPRPAGFHWVDRHVSLDPGGSRDNSGALFAYVDFAGGGVVVVEDEILMFKATTRSLAEAIRERELALWGDLKVRSRVVDDPTPWDLVVNDFANEHSLYFAPARKDNRDQAINKLRMMIASRKFIVHPRCVHLIRQLRNAILNKQSKDMMRSTTDAHFDLVAAAWYLCRDVDPTHNPYPKDWDLQPNQRRAFTPANLSPQPSTPLQAALSTKGNSRTLFKKKVGHA